MSMMSRNDVFALLERGTGTEAGIHRDIGLVNCARQVTLNELNRGFTWAFQRDVGTIFHALAALWHQGELIRIPRPSQQADWSPVDPLFSVVEEAWRVFENYAQRVPPHGWGHVIAAELPLDGKLPNGTRKTGQLDLLTRWCGCKAVCQEMVERTLLPMVEGVYIVDHKVNSQRDSIIATRYALAVQPTTYQYLVKQLRPDLDLQGMIINQVIRHKELTERSYCSVLVDPPDDNKVRRLTEFVEFAAELEKRNVANLNNCIDRWNNICPHSLNGACY